MITFEERIKQLEDNKMFIMNWIEDEIGYKL